VDLSQVLALAVGLGLDAMSVSAAVGVRWHGRRQIFRLSWHMGMFQFGMPIIGWAIGSSLAGMLAGVGSYVAAALVFGVGAKMLYEALKESPGSVEERAEHAVEDALHLPHDPTRGWSLIVLSIATSIDALLAGFSLALKGHGILVSSLIIGIIAAAMALTGVLIGKHAGKAIGRPAEILGAVVLMALGVSFIWI
jgi:putative Mn2+ efflux pump MntP